MSSKYKILLCEDDKFTADLYLNKLKLEGFATLYANNGQDALDIIKSKKPDLVILDLMLPRLNGFDVLKKVKESDDQSLIKIPKIVSSNLAQESDISEVIELGAVDTFVKSRVTPSEMTEIVIKHLPEKNSQSK